MQSLEFQRLVIEQGRSYKRCHRGMPGLQGAVQIYWLK